MHADKVEVAILAGGQSRRMGTNKALMRLDEGGPTVIETVVARLREAGLRAPLLVTNNPEEYSFMGLESVRDDIEGAGALGGLGTALRHSRGSRVLVVACDMPLLSVRLIKHMRSVAGQYEALVPRWNEGKQVRVEPLHAIYSVGCAEAAERQIREGRLKVSSFLDGINVTYLDELEIRRYDPELRSFYNVNTPEGWGRLKREVGNEALG
jgi:molybdopterin-guanine dinucleotide biosynthesis protein A